VKVSAVTAIDTVESAAAEGATIAPATTPAAAITAIVLLTRIGGHSGRPRKHSCGRETDLSTAMVPK